jgi:hypothetical protein
MFERSVARFRRRVHRRQAPDHADEIALPSAAGFGSFRDRGTTHDFIWEHDVLIGMG